MKKIILSILLFWGLVLFGVNNIALAQTVNVGVKTSNYYYFATATVASDGEVTKKVMNPLYHEKKKKYPNQVDETIGFSKSKTVSFSVSGDVELGMDSEALGLKLLGTAGCGSSVSTTISKSYQKNILRGDKTGYYWLEAFCPTSKLKVTSTKYKTSISGIQKLIARKSVTLRFAPKLNKVSYRCKYSKTR